MVSDTETYMVQPNQTVLILVLMEDGLGPSESQP